MNHGLAFLQTPPFVLLLCPPPPPLSRLPSFLQPPSLIHIHVWYCLWAAINHVSGASSQKGEASTRSLLPAPYQENTFKEHMGGGGRGAETVEKVNGERYGEAGKGGRQRLHFKPRPPCPTANIGTSCIWFLFWLFLVLFSWSLVKLACHSFQSSRKCYFLEHCQSCKWELI